MHHMRGGGKPRDGGLTGQFTGGDLSVGEYRSRNAGADPGKAG
jgi:hypothetical protein